jgi:hypothetical protein
MCPIEGCEYINGKFTCPLIEIVTCGECMHYTDHDCPIDWESLTVNDFCSYGERRTGTLDERIKRGLKEWREK